MAEGVVDALEAVAVGHDDRDGVLAGVEGVLHVVEAAAVGQAGERVGVGAALPAHAQLLLLGDVVDQADDADDVAVVAVHGALDDLEVLRHAGDVLLDGVGAADARLDDLAVLLHGEQGVVLVLADVEVRLAADGPPLLVAVEVVPVLGREHVAAVAVLEEHARRQLAEHALHEAEVVEVVLHRCALPFAVADIPAREACGLFARIRVVYHALKAFAGGRRPWNLATNYPREALQRLTSRRPRLHFSPVAIILLRWVIGAFGGDVEYTVHIAQRSLLSRVIFANSTGRPNNWFAVLTYLDCNKLRGVARAVYDRVSCARWNSSIYDIIYIAAA